MAKGRAADFRPVAEIAAGIRDAMLAYGFTRVESVTMAREWFVQTMLEQARNPHRPQLQDLLAKLDIPGGKPS